MIQTLIPTVCSKLCNIILWSTVSKTAQITHIPIIILLNEEGRLCRSVLSVDSMSGVAAPGEQLVSYRSVCLLSE